MESLVQRANGLRPPGLFARPRCSDVAHGVHRVKLRCNAGGQIVSSLLGLLGLGPKPHTNIITGKAEPLAKTKVRRCSKPQPVLIQRQVCKNLIVLLDPKRNRLIYVLGADDPTKAAHKLELLLGAAKASEVMLLEDSACQLPTAVHQVVHERLLGLTTISCCSEESRWESGHASSHGVLVGDANVPSTSYSSKNPGKGQDSRSKQSLHWAMQRRKPRRELPLMQHLKTLARGQSQLPNRKWTGLATRYRDARRSGFPLSPRVTVVQNKHLNVMPHSQELMLDAGAASDGGILPPSVFNCEMQLGPEQDDFTVLFNINDSMDIDDGRTMKLPPSGENPYPALERLFQETANESTPSVAEAEQDTSTSDPRAPELWGLSSGASTAWAKLQSDYGEHKLTAPLRKVVPDDALHKAYEDFVCELEKTESEHTGSSGAQDISSPAGPAGHHHGVPSINQHRNEGDHSLPSGRSSKGISSGGSSSSLGDGRRSGKAAHGHSSSFQADGHVTDDEGDGPLDGKSVAYWILGLNASDADVERLGKAITLAIEDDSDLQAAVRGSTVQLQLQRAFPSHSQQVITHRSKKKVNLKVPEKVFDLAEVIDDSKKDRGDSKARGQRNSTSAGRSARLRKAVASAVAATAAAAGLAHPVQNSTDDEDPAASSLPSSSSGAACPQHQHPFSATASLSSHDGSESSSASDPQRQQQLVQALMQALRVPGSSARSPMARQDVVVLASSALLPLVGQAWQELEQRCMMPGVVAVAR